MLESQGQNSPTVQSEQEFWPKAQLAGKFPNEVHADVTYSCSGIPTLRASQAGGCGW